jgi:hypothetical protein
LREASSPAGGGVWAPGGVLREAGEDERLEELAYSRSSCPGQCRRLRKLLVRHLYRVVLGFYVAVNDALPVGVGKPRGDVGAYPRKPSLGKRPLFVYEGLEVASGDVLHDYVGDLATV